jgi:hypothetical protein
VDGNRRVATALLSLCRVRQDFLDAGGRAQRRWRGVIRFAATGVAEARGDRVTNSVCQSVRSWLQTITHIVFCGDRTGIAKHLPRISIL